MKNKNWILAHFHPIFGSFLADFHFELKWKRSQAEPSWKPFSSSYGSSQLGSDSSLVFRLGSLLGIDCYARILNVRLGFGWTVWVLQWQSGIPWVWFKWFVPPNYGCCVLTRLSGWSVVRYCQLWWLRIWRRRSFRVEYVVHVVGYDGGFTIGGMLSSLSFVFFCSKSVCLSDALSTWCYVGDLWLLFAGEMLITPL